MTMAECPRCDGSLVADYLGNIRTERCGRCEGRWFARGDLSLLMQSAYAPYLLKELIIHPGAELPRGSDETECPECAVPLKTRIMGTLGNARVDLCPRCRGTWVDPEEMGRLLRHKKGTNVVAELWNHFKAALFGPNGVIR